MNQVLKFILDLLFPVLCQGCGAEGAYLCLSCQNNIEPALERCLVCSQNSLLGKIHKDCRNSKGRAWALDNLMVATNYHNEAIKKLIWHFKYGSVAAISEIFAALMADYLVKKDLLEYFENALVIPVPSHKKRLKLRGFNQAEILAQKFAQSLNLGYLPILQKIRPTKRQVDLEKEKRFENVRNAFFAPPIPSLGERIVIIVDDVATTGATLNECAKVLKTQNPREIWGFVVARN